jgi:putative spermidine/putrescine transport system permease protein
LAFTESKTADTAIKPLKSASRKSTGDDVYWMMVAPGALLAVVFICFPILLLIHQSLLTHNPGEVGANADAGLTVGNYSLVVGPSYFRYYWDTFRISAISAVAAVAVSALLAYRIANARSAFSRKSLVALMLGLMFLSVLVRVYAISLTFGVTGPVGMTLRQMGVNINSRSYTEFLVILGFLHFLIPISTLILIGTFQRIPHSLFEAATSLGAKRWRAHLDTTFRAALPGLYSTLVVAFSLAVSSFVIPLILGQGKIQFIANLAYIRFGEMADYPSGSAFAICLLAASLFIVGILGKLVGRMIRGV